MCVIRSVVNHTVGGWLLSHHEGGKKINIRENMLDYMISLFDDANDFSWDAAKASHTNMITQRQKTKVYYSSVVSKARQHSNIDKNTAIRYFTRQKAYQTISANKSYADALKFGEDSSAKVKANPQQIKNITNLDPAKQGVHIYKTYYYCYYY